MPQTTLDALSKKLNLQPPFFIKLDVQGLEERVLKGGSEILKNTHVIVCEAIIREFQEINKYLAEQDFVLYDAVEMLRDNTETLLQFIQSI